MTGKSKGYAFVEYEHESDARAAHRVRFPPTCATRLGAHQSLLGSRSRWQDMHGKDIDQARVLVEMERERTMAGWVPRRLGTRFQRRRPAAPLVCLTHRPTCGTGGGLGGKKESGQIRFGGRDRPWRQPLRLNQYDGPAATAFPIPSTQGLD